MPRPARGLVRVSTAQQNEKYGPIIQRNAIKKYAADNDFEIVAFYQDTESGASETRAEFYRLLSEAEPGESVIFFDLTRLARTERLAHEFTHLIAQAGLEAHATNRGLIEAGLLTSLDMAISAEERRTIARRMRSGILARADAGLPPNGIALYGFRNMPRALPVLEPTEAHHLRRLYALSALVPSWRELAKRADAEGIPSPHDGTWAHNNVRRTITNPAYKGQLIWPRGTKYQSKTPSRIIEIPPIVTPEVWQAAQKPVGVGAKPKLHTPLSGRLKCGVCGFGFSVQRKPNKHMPDRNYYRCNSRGRLEGKCVLPQIRAWDFEEAVELEFRAVLTDSVRLTALFDEAEAARAPDPRLVELRAREASFVEAFRKGDLTPDEFGVLRREIRAEIATFDRVDNETNYPLDEYREAALTLPFAELARYAKLTVIVLPDGFRLSLGGV